MKIKLTYLLIVAISISLFISCVPEDDRPETTIFKIENDNTISIENNNSLFNIDDTIIINTVVENTQTTTDGLKITLTDYFENDEESKIVWYRLHLFKESNFGGLIRIPIDDKYIESIEGTSETEGGSSILTTATLTNDTFKSKFGIKLKEAGTYYLTNSLHRGEIIISSGDYEKGIIHIYTKIINSDENNRYKFTVK